MFVKSIVGLTLVALVAAQSGGNSANKTIDPAQVDASIRSQWCSGEINTCGTLCVGDYDSNTCNPDTLNYTCLCTSNSSSPGLEYYQQSMPTFICEKIFENCITAGQNDAAAQKLCTTARAKNCGTLDPNKFVAAASSSSSSSASATATGSSASSATSASAPAATSKGAATALNIGREYGTGIFAAGVVGIFGLML